jgi:predicted TIM-barrel fold metal-dependent hydrolase
MPSRLIDSHHHLWDLEANAYPWLQLETPPAIFIGDVSPIMRPYRLDAFLTDSAGQGLVKSVHVEAGFDPGDPVGETRWLQALADEHGFPHGIVAHARLNAGDVEDVLDAHRSFANVRGVRQIVMADADPRYALAESPDLLSQPGWRKGFALLEPRNLSFDLQLLPHQMADAAALARVFPDTRIVIDHAGLPLLHEAGGFDRWRQGMRVLAEHANVAVKLSGLGMIDHRWTVESVRPVVSTTIELFGVDRCMFASNFPVDSMYRSYAAWVGALEAITSDLGLTGNEQDALFYRVAECWYRL